MDLLRDLYARFRVLIHEVAKFGIVGVLAFILTLGGANVLHSGAGLGPLTSATIANVVATVFAFLGNKLWAFRHRKAATGAASRSCSSSSTASGCSSSSVSSRSRATGSG